MSARSVKYNPSFLSDKELVDCFVVRQLDLELIVEVVRDNDTAPNQHVLVIGPRGSGKTTLLRRTAIALTSDDELGKRWLPLIFAEESYQVTSPGEFWLEAVFHVAEQTGQESWRRVHEELNRESDEARLRERALAQLLDYSDSVGKRLLLIVENLQMLTQQLSDDDAWKLRHTLQCDARIMFLASATTRFKAIDDAGKAFYELFKVHSLKPLNEAECHAVWVSTTGRQPEEGSIRPVQILTGGNLRLMTIISRFGAKLSFTELLAELMHLVDEHTEYFKSQLDGLAAIERKVYLGLAELWSPATAKQVGEVARLDVHKTSTLLGRLEQRGAVTVVGRKGRAKIYQVSERLYNIYYLMRRRGSPSRRVKAVVSFMIGYYGPRTLVELASNIAREACDADNPSRADHFAVYAQLLDSPATKQVREQILRATPDIFFEHPDAPESFHEQAESWARAAVELSPTEPNAAHTYASILCGRGALPEALRAVRSYLEQPDVVKKTTKDAVSLFTEIAARGAADDALEVLKTSPSMAALEPLIVALELDTGRNATAPNEIIEVAKDILRDIHDRREALGD
jgi:energy-coupling factor transporter ATP-binding protein EcfA2